MRRQEVNVGVTAKPALGVHICPATQAELEALLAGLDANALSQRLVFESARDGGIAGRSP